MKNLFIFVRLAVVTTFIFEIFSTSTEAVGVDYSGYLRSRGNFIYNLDLDRDNAPEVRGYTDVRFRLNPTFFVSDKIRVRTSLNFLDGQLGDNPLRSDAYTNPARSTHPLYDPAGTETTVGRTTNSTSSLGGAYAPDAGVKTAGLIPINLRRAWLEWEFEYGTFMVGRMPSHWGLGIYSNAGDDPNQEVGTTKDRIQFDTSFGSYYVRPALSWISEGDLDQSSDDYIEYVFAFGRKTDLQDLGIYISYLGQDGARNATTNGSLNGLDTGYWAFDFFGSHDFGNNKLAGEVALFTGTFAGKDLLATNAVLRNVWDNKPWTILLEAGYSSGTTAGEATSGDLKTFLFSRDYDVSYIVFEEALPGGAVLTDATSATVSTAPHSGAVSNTYYPRLKLTLDAADFFQPSFNIIAPFAAARSTGSGGRFYGVEYDLITNWPINQFVTAEFTFAHFLPGSFYDNVSQSQSAFMLRGGLLAKF